MISFGHDSPSPEMFFLKVQSKTLIKVSAKLKSLRSIMVI